LGFASSFFVSSVPALGLSLTAASSLGFSFDLSAAAAAGFFSSFLPSSFGFSAGLAAVAAFSSKILPLS